MVKNGIRRSALAFAGATAGLATVMTAPGVALADSSAPAAEDQPTARMTLVSEDGEMTIQGTCGTKKTPEIVDGWGFVTARAYWSVWCQGGNVYMEGWVDDTRSDGKCAMVRGVFPNSPTQYAKNCPADTPRTEFTFKGTGNRVDGFLYLD